MTRIVRTAVLVALLLCLASGVASAASPEGQKVAYTLYGPADTSGFSPFIVLVDKLHGTAAVFPRLHFGNFQGGALVAGLNAAKTGPGTQLYHSSIFTDPAEVHPGDRPDLLHTAVEVAFVSSQQVLDETGRIFVAIVDGRNGGVRVWLSSDGGVIYTYTGQWFPFVLDNPNDAYAPHFNTMRGEFEKIVGGPSANPPLPRGFQ